MINLLSNGFFQSFLAAIAFGFLVWLIQKIRFVFDEKKIVRFIKNSKDSFRSTEAIVSDTNLEQIRVQHVCARSSKIRRNQKEKESWCLS
jgi:hypothetical protein